MNLRLLHLIGLFGMWLVLTAAPAAAQFRTGGLQEMDFVSGATSTTCAANSANLVDNIVWGTASGSKSRRAPSDARPSCAASVADENIVWGTLFQDNIVWGTVDTSDNIVWGTVFTHDNIVWGTADTTDNIVWGTGFGDDNIVWGTAASSSAFDF